MNVQVKWIGTIRDLDDRRDLVLYTDSQDVREVQEHLGNHEDIMGFGGFLVDIDEGELVEIYGFTNCVPYLHLPLFKITWSYGHE